MSGTGVATRKAEEDDRDIFVESIRLIPPLPYSPTRIPAEKLRNTIIQVVRERQAKVREASLNGSDQ